MQRHPPPIISRMDLGVVLLYHALALSISNSTVKNASRPIATFRDPYTLYNMYPFGNAQWAKVLKTFPSRLQNISECRNHNSIIIKTVFNDKMNPEVKGLNPNKDNCYCFSKLC